MLGPLDSHIYQEGLRSLDALAPVKVAVVGDTMLDRFLRGRVDRISPEAPVPVVHIQDEEERLGGAANVAANVAALGAGVELFAVCGRDGAAQRMESMLRDRGIGGSGLVQSGRRTTTVKTRILAAGQQVVRLDEESTGHLDDDDRSELLERLRRAAPFDAVIVSDYGKGVVDLELMDLLREWKAAGSPVVVDPKQGNFDLYRGVTAITPNEKEAGGACHESIEGDDDAARVAAILRDRLGTDMILLTRGENGLYLLEDGGRSHWIPTEARQVFDVTGAGDTVIAGFTTLLAAGAAAEVAARLANAAAGIAVGALGTAVVGQESLRQAWRRRAKEEGR